MNFINTFFDSLLHLVYPRVCAGCGSDVLSNDQHICLECMHELPLTGFFGFTGNPVEKIFYGRLSLEAAGALMYFTKNSVVQRLLHELKYRGNRELGQYLGEMMGKELSRSERFSTVAGIVPLPLHASRERKRGYNQSEVLAAGIAQVMRIPVWTDLIRRKKNTHTQTRKTRAERWRNIEAGFQLKNKMHVGKEHLLLVDDVITTGATIEACGAELLKVQGIRVSVASLAYTA